MGKLTRLFFVLLVAFLAACSVNESADNDKKNDKSANEKQEETKDKELSVDKGLFNVEITIPASFYEGEDIDSVIAEAEKEGAKNVKVNEDGSLTYQMSKSDHKKLMDEMGTSIKDSIEEMKSSGDYASIKDITHNQSFTEFTILVDKASFENSFDTLSILALGVEGSMYQIFNGKNPDDYQVTIFLKDEATQEVYDEVIFPQALEEMGEAKETTE